MNSRDSEEFLPLLEKKGKNEIEHDFNYQSVGNFMKRKLDESNNPSTSQSGFTDFKQERSILSRHETSFPSHYKITYCWNKLNVYGISNSGSVLKRMWSKKNNFRREEKKQILKNVSGIAYPGEILAVMGPSGAGKTTLLNALSFQSGSNAVADGFRYLNGRLATHRSAVASLSAYVEQNTLFLGNLTVAEHLIFQALIRMDRTFSYEQKLKRVEEVITELDLEKCRNTVIGCLGKTKGISGGEIKRLSLASEMLTNPPLMFCDEPTSGLDYGLALNVTKVLKSMALKGKTVICTIHQPSTEMLFVFDKILILAEGRTAFLGSPNDASCFFADLGASPLAYHNVSDIFMGLLSVIPKQEESSRETIKYICDRFEQSNYGQEIECKIEDSSGRNSGVEGSVRCVQSWNSSLYDSSYNSEFKATWLTQFRALFWRCWLNLIKESLLVKVRLFQTVMLSLVVGLIYHGQKLDENGVMNINGVLFTFLTNMTFQNLFGVITVFCCELPIFLMEHGKKMYRIDAYFLSKTLVEIPIFVMIPLIFVSLTYFWIGLNSGVENFFYAILILVLVTNVATSFGYFISCASKNVLMALSVGPPIIIPFLLFGGFLINTGTIPVYFKWLSYLSWFKYGNEALLINQWENVEGIECTKINSTCPRNGDIVLQMYHFQKENFSWDLASLGFLILIFRFAAYLLLCIRTLAISK